MIGGEYSTIRCSVCGAKTRRPFIKGPQQKAKRQRPKWWVCDNGHKLIRKVSQ